MTVHARYSDSGVAVPYPSGLDDLGIEAEIENAKNEARVAGDGRDPVVHGLVFVALSGVHEVYASHLLRVAAVRAAEGKGSEVIDRRLAAVLGREGVTRFDRDVELYRAIINGGGEVPFEWSSARYDLDSYVDPSANER